MNEDIPEYRITRFVLGSPGFISISKLEYDKIARAKTILMFGLGLEAKFDLLMENYYEFEKTMLNLSLDYSIFPGNIEKLLDYGTVILNRRLINLLSTSRLYKNQLLHDFAKIYGEKSSQFRKYILAMQSEYDSCLGYRFLDALRNHIQHRSLPIDSVKYKISKDKLVENTNISFSIEPAVNLIYLQEDIKFKKSILREIDALADKQKIFAIVPSVRDYIECLGRIHLIARSLVSRDLMKSDMVIAKYINLGRKKFDGRTSGLVAISCDAHGISHSKEFLIDRPTALRREFERKNLHLEGLSYRYVTSKTR